jgi:uncharacterized protein (TIGR02145 family)
MKRATIALLVICTAVFAQQKGTGTFTDPRDKKKYKTVKIGEQTWMAENLGYNAKGSKCPGEDDSKKSIRCAKKDVFAECFNIECTRWAEDGDYQAFCAEYKNLTAKQIQDRDKKVQADCAKYGRLYDWEMSKTACPVGWHLPTEGEWYNLGKTVGGNETAGKKLKAKSGWAEGGNGTDEYGFTALPVSSGSAAYWIASSSGSLYCEMTASDKAEQKHDYNKTLKSIRCVEGKSEEEKEADEKAAIEKAVGKQFNSKIKYGSITDARDKITYKTVKIGEQTWMAENLNYNAKGSKCYNDKEHYCKRDGRLYDLAGAKTSCPAGWHLATDGEWKILEDAVGGKETAGTKLKATSGWFDSTAKKATNGTDDFGFSALPAGSASNYGKNFNRGGSSGLWWTASGEITREISEAESKSSTANKSILFSVRCVEGEPPKEEAPAPAPAKAPTAAPANNPSKPMYCVIYMGGKISSCTELKDTQEDKANCDMQNKGLKFMRGEAKWTESKPDIKCGK